MQTCAEKKQHRTKNKKRKSTSAPWPWLARHAKPRSHDLSFYLVVHQDWTVFVHVFLSGTQARPGSQVPRRCWFILIFARFGQTFASMPEWTLLRRPHARLTGYIEYRTQAKQLMQPNNTAASRQSQTILNTYYLPFITCASAQVAKAVVWA